MIHNDLLAVALELSREDMQDLTRKLAQFHINDVGLDFQENSIEFKLFLLDVFKLWRIVSETRLKIPF